LLPSVHAPLREQNQALVAWVDLVDCHELRAAQEYDRDIRDGRRLDHGTAGGHRLHTYPDLGALLLGVER
jgi:hypothetical protein